MKKVYFVTTNEGKVANAKTALQPFGLDVRQVKIELVESRAEDPADIALEKAEQAYKKLRRPVIVEDSGFFIKALGGFPMTHIKFSLKTLGLKNILHALEGVKSRHAEWRMTLAYVWGPGKHRKFTFIERGKIAMTPRPVKRPMMSDYWRVYVPTMIPNRKALCEMTDADLKRWQDYYAGHNQFQMFGRWFKKRNA